MKIEKIVCDLCWSDGEEAMATHNYVNDEGKDFVCCDKHLSFVKQLKLPYSKIPESERIVEME